MRPPDVALAKEVNRKLETFINIHPLPGIRIATSRNCLIAQIVDSVRRIKYVSLISSQSPSIIYTDPASKFFDPLKAAVYYKNRKNFEEAFWLVFLSIHFGKNKTTGWNLLRNVYKGNNKTWTWQHITTNLKEFRQWLDVNQAQLKELANFGNHRKYESLNGLGSNGTGAAIASYIEWIGPTFKHMDLIKTFKEKDPKKLFHILYNSMSQVNRFGRMGKFDYLTMIGKLGLVNIEPPSAYMVGATGPVDGANLLFFGNPKTSHSLHQLDDLIKLLNDHLNLYFGMQVLEDALCNWQKSPEKYIYFKG